MIRVGQIWRGRDTIIRVERVDWPRNETSYVGWVRPMDVRGRADDMVAQIGIDRMKLVADPAETTRLRAALKRIANSDCASADALVEFAKRSLGGG